MLIDGLKSLLPARWRVSGRFAGEFSSAGYWARRYAASGNSGAGSYGRLAEFKAEVLNDFVARQGVRNVLEFGCGDGNQLTLARYPKYYGIDVAPEAVDRCRTRFQKDSTKRFDCLDDYDGSGAELVMSLDVIFHLVEDEVYESYMKRLFAAASRFVVVYSSNTDQNPTIRPPHVFHRRFSDWVRANEPAWVLAERVPNRYPYDGDDANSSFADFYFFRKS